MPDVDSLRTNEEKVCGQTTRNGLSRQGSVVRTAIVRWQNMGVLHHEIVEADSAFSAESLAREHVHEVLKGLLLNKPDEPWTLTIDETWEDSEAFAEYAPGAGFTWYSGDSEDLDDDDDESRPDSLDRQNSFRRES